MTRPSYEAVRDTGAAVLLAAYQAMNDYVRLQLIAAARAGAEHFPRLEPASALVCAISPDEDRLLGHFRAAADDARVDILAATAAVAERWPRERLALTLVEGGRGRPGRGFAASSKTHMERTSDGK